ncbi:hypothetical protein [Mesorhizobium sp.]|uniref:hypothetical protein n=1 Tax=Mesorhizobium sp. TaxID=1871066 RepID=UPI001221A613|nr:hypothetical protein [Mesorhizobium sp.]TIM05509.1 MAG: hypothetical protein E5Y62_27345 [Mesorhizobium sp.]
MFAEPWRQLTLTDWFFVFCGWLTAAWAFYICIDTFSGTKATGFDFLPVAAGVPTVLGGWRAAKMHSMITAALEGLLKGAGLDLSGDMAAFEAALKRRVKLWSLATGTAIAGCFGAYLGWALYKFGTAGLFFLLAVVCVAIGFQIGRMLGSLLGYGQILTVMRDTGIAIGSIDTEQARRAIARIEELLSYTFWLTAGMCHWFALWFVFWFLGFDDYRAAHSGLFIAFWMVSYALYLFAARSPILAFRARLSELQGGPEGQAARQRQLAEAREDLARLSLTADGSRHSERHELEILVHEFEARNAPPQLPRRWHLNVLAAWIALLLAGSIAGTLLGIGSDTTPVAQESAI